MKNIKEYLLIKEAWGDNTNYERELKELVKTYKDKQEKFNARVEKRKKTGKGYIPRHSHAYDVFKKYPISILVDKLGYKFDFEKFNNLRSWEKNEQKSYAASFLADKIDKGEVTPEELAQWWKEYNEKVNKKNYFDPEWIVKQLDTTKFFNPYDPDDTYIIDEIIDNPERILYYMKTGYNFKRKKKKGETYSYSILYDLKEEEKEELLTFYTEPQNLEKLHNIFKKSRNKFLRARPKFSESVDKWLQRIFEEDIEYDGCDLQDKLEKELNTRRSMYQGSNDFDDEAKEIISCVIKALDKVYHLSINNYVETQTDEWDDSTTKSYRYSHHSQTTDDQRRNFVKDCKSGIDIKVHKAGRHKAEHGPVASSSFWTTYGYDIDVKITVYDPDAEDNKRVVFDDTFENVPLYSSYYSGGWN